MLQLNLTSSFRIFFSTLILFSFSSIQAQEKEKMNPPKAEKIKKELTKHGHTRIDNYYWLNERTNPKVIEYLNEENEYTNAMCRHTETLQEKLFKEILARVKQDDQSVPYKDNGFYYYVRYQEGREYPLYCRKKETLDAEEEIMLNVNEMAESYSFYHVTGLSVSPDNNYLAFGVDTLSRRIYDIYFKDLQTGKIIPEKISGTAGSAAWANDSKTLFYSVKDNTLRPYQIKKHILGTDYLKDDEIFSEDDPTYITTVYRTKSDKYLVIGSFSTTTTEYRVLNADHADGDFRIFYTREKNLEYYIDHFEDNFYIKTNYNARNFRLMKTPLDKTSKENWIDVVPHREDVLLEELSIFKKFLVLQERQNGLTQLRIINWSGNSDHYIDFGEAAYVASLSANPQFDSDFLRFSYSSLITPASVYDYDMNTREKVLLKQEEILGGYSSSDYFSERLYASADDETKIPISMVYKKGIKKDGENPVLLYGYGSYAISSEPNFSSVRLSLLDRGFIFAIAHVRGGQEMGRQWYEEGKLLKKKNTFTDFIACADHLVKEKYTNPDKLFAKGGSAGGLLIGAVVNLRPDLFKGVVAAVPFVDVITTMLDDSIPLTTSEYDEWGNPNVKEYYDYILSYSPYDNVEAKDYPNMLITTGLHDSQVQYWEPAKWVAKLRELKTDNNLLLLKTNMEAGHGGASGRFQKYKEIAFEYAFILNLLKINL